MRLFHIEAALRCRIHEHVLGVGCSFTLQINEQSLHSSSCVHDFSTFLTQDEDLLLGISAVSLLQFYNSFSKNSYTFWNLLHCSEGLFSDLYSHYYPLYWCNKDQQRWQAAHSLTQYAYFSDEGTMRCPSWRPRPLELHLLVMSLCFVWACVKPAFIVVLCRRLSLSGDKVHARKDAHSNLLSKKETSSLYKIQCKPHFAL